MSTWLCLCLGCTVHIGVAPIHGSWSVASVDAPVVEPEIDAWVREGLTTALAARGALAVTGTPLRVTVLEASWSPSRRGGGVLLYEARLTVRLEAGERVVTRTRVWGTVDEGGAGAARASREESFRVLARLIAEEMIASLGGS